MSAQITVERREQQQIAHYCDRLGYLYCSTCRAEGYGREPVVRLLDAWAARDERCDGCGCALSTSIETVVGWAVVEHVRCKIF